jgi:hypothetical protein
MKKFSLFLALAAVFATLVATAAFAQAVGGTYTLDGQTWTVQSLSGDTMTLRRAQAQTGAGPVNWTAVASSPFGTSDVIDVAYGNNTWVAVANEGKVAYSSDGRTWTLVTWTTAMPTPFGTSNNQMYAVAFGNGIFIAIGRQGMASSPDSRTWTKIATSNPSNLAFGGGRWVAVGGAGGTAYSTDNGSTWTNVSAGDVFGTSTAANRSGIFSVAYGNNRWVIGGDGGRMATSSNGTSWTAVANTTFPSGGQNYEINDIAYANNRWVAVGARGMAYSTDGANWTSVTTAVRAVVFQGGSSINVGGVAFGSAGNAGGRFVAVGGDGRIGYSTDGAAWTAVANTTIWQYTNDRNQTVQAYIRAVAYGSGRFVAVGQQGKMAYCDW